VIDRPCCCVAFVSSYTLPRDGRREARCSAIFTKLNSTPAGNVRNVGEHQGPSHACKDVVHCRPVRGEPWLGARLAYDPSPRRAGDPPSALIPCGTLRGAREGGAAGGFTAGSPPVVSTGMPPSLPSVPVVLANGMRVTPVQGNVYMLGGAGGNIAMQVGSDGALLVDSGRADRADAAIATLRLLTASPIRWINRLPHLERWARCPRGRLLSREEQADYRVAGYAGRVSGPHAAGPARSMRVINAAGKLRGRSNLILWSGHRQQRNRAPRNTALWLGRHSLGEAASPAGLGRTRGAVPDLADLGLDLRLGHPSWRSRSVVDLPPRTFR